MIFYFILDVSVSDMNDEDGAGGSSKSNSITSEHSLQSTGISASSQVIITIHSRPQCNILHHFVSKPEQLNLKTIYDTHISLMMWD